MNPTSFHSHASRRPSFRKLSQILLAFTAFALSLSLSGSIHAEDSDKLLTINHYVRVKSTVPSIAGQTAQLYVRERALAGLVARGSALGDKVVLFVHGAGTPAEVAFDTGYEDYSWMAYLAREGFDVFCMDVTGYGRSTRPEVMNDPGNLTAEQQSGLFSKGFPAPAASRHSQPMNTIASDWNDIGAVVDYLRELRHVERVSLIGWSLGGPRAGGYAVQHPEKIHKLVLLAPAYSRNGPSNPPSDLPPNGAPMNTQSRDEFFANWDRQLGCTNQFDPAARATVWKEMLESDPVGATWGSGVRRAPNTTVWGWNSAAAAKLQAPTLLVAAAHDKQVVPQGVRTLYDDLGATKKVFVDLACSSHNALWERNHTLLFKASLEWLAKGTVNGISEGVLQIGY